jgi:DNA-binding response OmpR family regulator
MQRILILDDNESFAKQLEYIVSGFDKTEETSIDLAFNPEQALALTYSSVQSGNLYTFFLVEQSLGASMDGINTMKELLAMSPSSDAVILTDFDNSEDGVRAYDAGASRYLSKTAEGIDLRVEWPSAIKKRKNRKQVAHDIQRNDGNRVAARKFSFHCKGNCRALIKIGV